METTNGCSIPRTSRTTDRLVYIDIAKALCIVLVVIGLLVKIVHKIGAVFVYWSKLVHK